MQKLCYPYFNAFPLIFKTLFKPIYFLSYCYVSAISLAHEQLNPIYFVSYQMLCELHLKHTQALCESFVIPIYTTIQTLLIYFQCYPYAIAM